MRKIWVRVKSFLSGVASWMAKYPLAVLLLVLTGIAVVVLSVFGRTLGPNTLLGKLLKRQESGRDEKKDRNGPPEDRKDKDGNPIRPGESDDKGFVQAPAEEMDEPGLFDDKGSVVVKKPDGGDSKVPLPTGVEPGDVRDVIVVQPDAKQTKNNDKGVDAGKVLDILKGRQ